jgi:hypothetical protein
MPKELQWQAVERELLRRKNASYLRRMGKLREEENVFGSCQTRRPNKGKYRNGYSREEAGTMGAMIVGISTGRYGVCVCQSKKH